MRARHVRGSLAEKFWAKAEPSEGCWTWAASRVLGYGQIWFEGRRLKAHRVSWELHFGAIPDGFWVLHRCDNRGCVRPEHLFLGEAADNVSDMMAKGRQGKTGARGARNGRARLSVEAVAGVRARYAAGGTTQVELAAEMGVTQAQISKIVRGRNWVRA